MTTRSSDCKGTVIFIETRHASQVKLEILTPDKVRVTYHDYKTAKHTIVIIHPVMALHIFAYLFMGDNPDCMIEDAPVNDSYQYLNQLLPNNALIP